MPYAVYKKGSGYKACKKDGKKCFSKKPMPKTKAQAQMKALYASESVVTEETHQDALEYFKLWKYPKANEYHTWFKLGDKSHVLVSLIFSAGETMDDVDYIETRITDGDAPNIQVFEDPHSEEAKEILSQYDLTGDDIENAGQESYEAIEKYMPKKEVEEEVVIEEFEFEKLYNSILQK